MLRGVSTTELIRLGLAKLREPLYRNAFLLTINSALGGLFGILFWLVVARLHASEAIGLSVSLLAVSGLLGSLSSLGLGVGLIHYLPSQSSGKSHRINTSLTLVSLSALGVGVLFLAGIGFWSPAFAFLIDTWSYAALFLAFTVGFALTPLVNSSFLAARKASYVLYRSMLYNGLRLSVAFLVVAYLGAAFGIFFSVGVALIVALIVGLLFLMPRLYPGFVPVPSLKVSDMRDMVKYSVGSHVADLFEALPSGILPLLILSVLSASSSAYFYIPWMMAGLLFLVPGSFAASLFIEGSHPGTHFAGDAVRSLRLGLLLLIPGVLLLFFAGSFLLGLFGVEYSTEGLSLLRILALSAFFVAINQIFFSSLLVNERITELILLSLILGVGIVIASYLLLDTLGLLAPGIAFLSIQAAISAYAILRNLGAVRWVVKRLVGT